MKLKLGIIGVGNIASAHIGNVLEGRCPEIEITALADRKESRREWARERIPTAAIFAEGTELIHSGTCEAVLIAVPVAILYLALQKYFVSGLTSGSTKG